MNPAEIHDGAGERRHAVQGLNPPPTTRHAPGKGNRSMRICFFKPSFSILKRTGQDQIYGERYSADLVAYLFE